MPQILALWNPGPSITFAPPRIFQELEFGEDVEGLVDLPIKEMIGELKQIFPQAVEKPGTLEGQGALGRVHVTWSWQWLRVEYADLTSDEESQIRQLAGRYRCGVFDVEAGSWSVGS